jgi:type III secretory pathway component EscT
MILFPRQSLLPIELFIALTVGVVFGLYFWGVNIYGIFIDRKRRFVYVALAVITSLWFVWAVVSWLFIDRMHYLT